MKKNYAVVDIETTGTDPKTDRIIQFGCVLIEDGKIVTHFSTDINPDQPIPAQIQTLTGITNQRIKRAPYFEDVAQTITNLLADTIFVAHNIHFDYPFLSNELERCGMPPLTIPGIDTVELEGKHFTTMVNQGDKVKLGQPLVQVDFDKVKEEGFDPTIIMVVTNTQDYLDVIPVSKDVISDKEECINIVL